MRLVKGPCRSQNYFGTQRVGNGFSIPSSWEYKMLWSERCGADWACDVFVASKCAPLVHNLYLGKWKKLNHMKEIVSEVCHKLILNFLLTFKSFQSDFGSFQLLPSDRKKNIYIFFIDTPPGKIF